MPIGESKTEKSQKKSRTTTKNKSKHGKTSKKQSNNPVNQIRESEFDQLTPANLSSLRWEHVLEDPALEEDRIEQYKELRRQRYAEAQQQQAKQKLIEKKK